MPAFRAGIALTPTRHGRCFSARLPGTLDELEAAALAAETEPSLWAEAECARPGHVITEAANRRWLKCQPVHASCTGNPWLGL